MFGCLVADAADGRITRPAAETEPDGLSDDEVQFSVSETVGGFLDPVAAAQGRPPPGMPVVEFNGTAQQGVQAIQRKWPSPLQQTSGWASNAR